MAFYKEIMQLTLRKNAFGKISLISSYKAFEKDLLMSFYNAQFLYIRNPQKDFSIG